jgi:hypothetical protein
MLSDSFRWFSLRFNYRLLSNNRSLSSRLVMTVLSGIVLSTKLPHNSHNQLNRLQLTTSD